MFETTRRDGVAQVRREGARWLSTAWDGGYCESETAYNVTVPTGFSRTDLDAYRERRLADAGFPVGPTLLTGVAMSHARVATSGPVSVLATAGLSNPAVLPVDGDEERGDRRDSDDSRPWRAGTVNLVVGVDRALSDGALATLLGTVVEAKAATLLAVADAPGTTSDAVLVGTDPTADPAAFAGSATEVGAATRVCVRDAVLASLDARYDDGPPAPAAAEYGVVTDRQTDVRQP
ncbi:adenosylcobinamide amidohydrolase [Haloarcula onubensis]|uniref:Adenosylcobinamide amidohydrolase n=1 Tax=Haloarcula onubensis TaxID=2950539 RepID=A0ABU2FKU6_9EURY|nr:adenosylcobinamide amidohydrolase [Halomicroarcula sp. S3CR25-11]MDS0280937.1 adenosylcobinamide amidohydrolase [Halomicroarcula sp. S3CR25-11]